MTGTTRSSEGLDARRRQLLFRAWHRGMREMDLIMGRFADAASARLSEAELDRVRAADRTCRTATCWPGSPARRRCRRTTTRALFRRLRDFHSSGEGRPMMARSPAELLAPGRPLTLAGVADGAEGLVVADLARAVAARAERAGDEPRWSSAATARAWRRLSRALAFFAPDIAVLEFPAWDCLPYDRVSPHAGVVAQRMTTLSRLARLKGRDRPSVLLTTVNAALQRVPRASAGRDAVALGRARQRARHGRHHALARAQRLLRAPRPCASPATTRCAAASSISIAPGMAEPVRLDFFGDTLETIRTFDPETQRTTDQLRALDLVPVAEFQLTTETIKRFRLGYVEAFGAPTPDDLLYAGGQRRPPPSRHGALAAAVPRPARDAVRLRAGLAGRARAAGRGRRARAPRPDHRLLRGARSRRSTERDAGPPYKPLPPDRLYLADAEWRERLDAAALARLTPFAVPEGARRVDRRRHPAGPQFRGRARRARPQRLRGGDRARARAAGRAASASSSRCGARARASA